MARIKAPRITFDHPDRFLSCQEQIDVAARDMLAAAVRAGWTEQEATAALVEVADNRMLAHIANQKTEDRIAPPSWSADHGPLRLDDPSTRP
ncbi:hypothetical protein LJR098_002219 [Rhizobium sp. LjRoot98]|uniref:hypothetical protein n=1 Tax=Rhizobium sp. LjRoot98 TaxID=3342345 RepID=UPI0007150BBC|nr:hypothetical protein ASC96_29115 [Rhizobium sp. Root1204]